MGWFSDNTVKISIDLELKNIIDSVKNNAGAKTDADALRYAVLHSVFPWSKGKKTNQGGDTKKRESTDKRTARLTAALEQIISTNESKGQPILMRITAAERAALGTTEIAVKHWQIAITERLIRDNTNVNQATAAAFLEQQKDQINKHNKWLFDNCGWHPKDAHTFNRRTKAAARKFAQLGLSE